MEDIISRSTDRPPGGPRRKLAIAAAAVILAAVILAEHFPHGDSGAHPATAGRGGHDGAKTIIRLRAEVPAGPSGIVGVHLPVPSWARLPRTGARPDWYWPATGTAAPIGGLPDHKLGYTFTRVGGGWAIVPQSAGRTGCGNCPGSPSPVYYLASSSRSADVVGSGTTAAPGADAGRIWLTTFAASRDLGTTAGVAREYSGTGVPIGPSVTLPVGYEIAQGTARGLLLAPVAASASTAVAADLLWNPAARRAIGHFYGVIAVGATWLAQAPPCTATCPVRVVSLRTGRSVVLQVPHGDTATGGYFSPDGRFLALQVSVGDNGADGALALQLEVADLARPRLVPVPHTWVSSDALDGFGWPGDGDNLAAELSFATRVQVAFWNPARARFAVADVSRHDYPAALVTG
jgi:hypothetical protein